MNDTVKAVIAATRFGLSPSGAATQYYSDRPAKRLRSQTKRKWKDRSGLPSGQVIIRKTQQMTVERRGKMGADKDAFEKKRRLFFKTVMEREILYRTEMALDPKNGFRERLVRFWSNHFTVSAKGNTPMQAMTGPFEREAIRANMTGSFYSMLLAATRHPAMQNYLDNARSIGPNSTAGRRNGKGLNENHAREILELHTVGVNGGYSQLDVTEFSKVLTGWGINWQRGGFEFQARNHEPGVRRVMGKIYRQSDQRQGEAILKYLARHRATADHIARKLAVAMHSDDPPETLVRRLRDTFIKSRGSLKSLHRALIKSPEMWDESRPKFKTPDEYIIGLYAISGQKPTSGKDIFKALQSLGQTPFMPNSPEGWSGVGDDWATPSGLKRRLDLATIFAKSNKDRGKPAKLGRAAFGPILRQRTMFHLKDASSPAQAWTLLFMSPEFQRR